MPLYLGSTAINGYPEPVAGIVEGFGALGGSKVGL